jgi:hypothetical protein
VVSVSWELNSVLKASAFWSSIVMAGGGFPLLVWSVLDFFGKYDSCRDIIICFRFGGRLRVVVVWP